uniref:Uncharacterized protein n=1 Tax=Ditylenchus dipsaci TaxID=166011 RepID=A0A915DS97_9BILA
MLYYLNVAPVLLQMYSLALIFLIVLMSKPLQIWNYFREPIRTNGRPGSLRRPGYSRLFSLLHTIEYQQSRRISMIAEGCRIKPKSRKYEQVTEKLEKYWDKYEEESKKRRQSIQVLSVGNRFLRKAAELVSDVSASGLRTVKAEKNAAVRKREAHRLEQGNESVNISGCLFHLVKNFKKQIATHGLSTRNQETEFALRAKMLMSLAFVPPENIWNDFRLLKTHLLAYDQALAPVINLFETYYVGTAMRDPMFPVRWWSCYQRTLAGEDRTNNFAEAAHRRLHTALGVDHPNEVGIWDVIQITIFRY